MPLMQTLGVTHTYTRRMEFNELTAHGWHDVLLEGDPQVPFGYLTCMFLTRSS